MDPTSPEQRSKSSWQEAEMRLYDIFVEIELAKFLEKSSHRPTIAILGAGPAVEVRALSAYFQACDLGKPKIIAFDIAEAGRMLTENNLLDKGVDLDYLISDIADPASFGEEEQYDLVVIRNPDIHTAPDAWEKAINNGFDHLKPQGAMLIVTDLHKSFVEGEIKKRGRIVKEYTIPNSAAVAAFVPVGDLFVAKKN